MVPSGETSQYVDNTFTDTFPVSEMKHGPGQVD
jgi:hypothetical protein